MTVIKLSLISLLWASRISALDAATANKSEPLNISDKIADRELGSEMMGFANKFQDANLEGSPKDNNAKAAWYHKLAGQGNAAAQNNLGVRYATGEGVPKNYSAALRWLKKAAEQNSAAAEFNLGFIYFTDSHMLSDASESAKWLKRSADHGYAPAQLLLWVSLMGETGLPKNEPEALNYLRNAANQGDPFAELMLGMEYNYGRGVPEDKKEAATWVHKAVDHNLPMAFLALAEMYEKGEGVVQDNTEALKWLRKSVDQGSPFGQMALAECYAKAKLGVLKDDAEAFKNYLLAANQGFNMAYHEVGDAYALGRGVQKNEQEAIKWFRKDGGAEIQFVILGDMFAKGDGVPKNGDEAIRWYRLAADEGNDLYRSRQKIAEMYIAGDGVPQDYTEALKWHRLAAVRGSQSAQNAVGKMYASGEGAPKDEIEALAWFYVSAAGEQPFYATQDIDILEHRLGREMAIIAQQRSKEIFKEIEAKKSLGTSSTLPEAAPKSSGTGSIISVHGHILTAAHVVASAAKITVVTSNGTRTATVFRIDERNDLAVLKIEGDDHRPLAVISSGSIRLGQTVATIGFPNIQIQGFSPKLTRGEISSLNGIGDDPRSWQISAPVQPGNSGGPLLDERGNLIGVVVSKLGLKATKATGDIPQNVNYAVKSAYALPLLEPYLSDTASQHSSAGQQLKFEDMVAQAEKSVVLILVY